MLQENPERYRGLNYPFGRATAPEPAEPQQVAEGVYWARFPMPMSLDHINIWLLQDDDGWTLRTADGSWTAQFEHTLLVTPTGAEILTQP